METERREVKIDIEKEKIKMLTEAKRLKNEYFADPYNWVLPEDYEGTAETEKRLEQKAMNKFRKGWLSQVDGFIIQNGLEDLPKDDADRLEMEGQMYDFIQILRAEIKRVMMEDKKVVQEALCEDEDFKNFAKACGLSHSDQIVIYMCVSKNMYEKVEEYLWSVANVMENFSSSEDNFQEKFRPLFGRWVQRYFEMERKYKSVSSQAVEAGDKILDIAIEVLSKKQK